MNWMGLWISLNIVGICVVRGERVNTCHVRFFQVNSDADKKAIWIFFFDIR